jgi:hypothetical protein
MTKSKAYQTKTGRNLSDADVEAISQEVENEDYDVEELKAKRRGRPAMGSGRAKVVPVRLDPELRKAVEARATEENTTTSDLIRQAIREFLKVS